MKAFIKTIFGAILVINTLFSACKTQKPFPEKLQSSIQQGTLLFNAISAAPMLDQMMMSAEISRILPPGSSIGSINLNGSYTFQLNPDQIISQLPYYGRVFSNVSYGTQKSALDYKSTDFTKEIKKIKNNSYLITLTFNDQRDVRKAYLTIGPDGHAQLRFIFTYRQALSFYGKISE